MKFLALLLIAALSVASPAAASEPTLGDLRRATGLKLDQYRIYVAGVSDGLSWLDQAAHRERGVEPLICVPPNLVLTPTLQSRLVRDYADKHKLPDDMPLGFAVMLASKDTYPCGQQERRP